MLHLNINGYTIIAYGTSYATDSETTVLGVRRFFDGFEYVVATVWNVEMDLDFNGQGFYTREFAKASERYQERVR
jgi:hypothetical protein